MTNEPQILGPLDTEPFQKFSIHLAGLKVYFLAALPIIIYSLHLRATRLRVTPKGVPWVGLRNEWFSKTRANIRELFNSKLNIEEGYKRVKQLFSRCSSSFCCILPY